jgi:hypothetical protein
MLCLGPGPSSLLHLTRANAEKPYAGDTDTGTKVFKFKSNGDIKRCERYLYFSIRKFCLKILHLQGLKTLR